MSGSLAPRRSLVALATALAVAAAAGGCGDEQPPPAVVEVPRIVGLRYTEATCRLAEAGLRWRGGGDPQVQARPPIPCEEDAGVAISVDPPVVSQRPRPGRRVRRGTVVLFEDECTVLRFKARQMACL